MEERPNTFPPGRDPSPRICPPPTNHRADAGARPWGISPLFTPNFPHPGGIGGDPFFNAGPKARQEFYGAHTPPDEDALGPHFAHH